MWPARSRRHPRAPHGLTLVELLISMALFALVSTGSYLLYTAMLGTYTTGEVRAEVQQTARVALAQLVQELRGAGADPSGALPLVTLPPHAALRAAQGTCLSVIGSVAPGGAESSVQISYWFDSSQRTLYRRVDAWTPPAFTGGTVQPLARAIQAIQLTYYDAAGSALTLSPQAAPQFCPPAASGPTPTPPQLGYEDLRRVRRVGITLRAQASGPRGTDEVYVLTSDVDLRNR